MSYCQAIIVRADGDKFEVVKDVSEVAEDWLASFAEQYAAVDWAETQAAAESLPFIDQTEQH